MEDIADAVGVLKGGLYYYIDTKETLLFQIILEAHDSLVDRFEVYAQVKGNALDKLHAFIEGHMRMNVTNLFLGANFYLNNSALSTEHREIIMERRRRFDNFLRRLMLDGKAEGTVRQEVDEKLAAIGILTSLNSAYLWFRPERGNVDYVAQQFADLFVQGLAVSGARDVAR
ncbi:hypothetical protein LMG26411_07441 [Cupriavidus numazuensis]|uniref:HTH tetR-type domain-containing protein n=2 Tax=Cupriavidus numazuensis TaxID=221992 RepID=A0ABN7QHX2_9BURK|nr:hypothetical protein LMG26411_07441 [Cupriavidus numazuensis]